MANLNTNTLSAAGTQQTAEAKQFYDRLLLERALPILAMYKAGMARNIPKNSGNSVSYRRINTLATATTALTEGVPPNGTALSITEVTGTVAQYGNYVTLSDYIDVLAIDPIVTETITLMSENAPQTVEEVIRAEMLNGTTVQYATGASRSAQGPSNPITLTQVRKAVRTLQSNDSNLYNGDRDNTTGQGGLYWGFIHPRMWFDLQGDSTVLNTFSYSDPQKLYTLKLPELAQVMWTVTTKAPVFTGAGASGADVYGAFIVGREAFGVVNVAGSGRFSAMNTPLGSAGAFDPLAQVATVGWKSWQLPKMLNNNFMVRLEAGVSA